MLTSQLFFEIDVIFASKNKFLPFVMEITSPTSFLKTLKICLLSSFENSELFDSFLRFGK